MNYLVIALLAAILNLDAAIVRLSGASSIEELSESEVERFRDMASRPMDLNSLSARKLYSTGLLTPFQAASIVDYISRNGDICSVAELGAVDGIGAQLASALSFFFILRPRGQLGAPSEGSVYYNQLQRCSVRDGTWTSALKADISLDSRCSAAVAVKEGRAVSGSLQYDGHGLLDRVAAGSLSARFGQGLLMWSGFSMSGLSSLGSFSRNASGIGRTSTLSEDSALKGVGASLALGSRFCASGLITDAALIAANLGFMGRQSTIGTTLVRDADGIRVSADFRGTWAGMTLFGEGALDFVSGGTAALLGTIWNISYGRKAGLLLRAYSPSYSSPYSGAPRCGSKSSDEYGASAGVKLPWLDTALDAVYHPSKGSSQYKLRSTFSGDWRLGNLTLSPSLRLNSRLMPEDRYPWRNEARVDVGAGLGSLMGHFRFDAVGSRDFGWLWYLEGGWKGELTAVLRFTLFRIDNWQDRIYVYERDAPGCFNVPAYYGRGYGLSLYCSWERMRLRIGTVRYPWIEKDPHFEVRVQLELKSQNLRPMLSPSAGD